MSVVVPTRMTGIGVLMAIALTTVPLIGQSTKPKPKPSQSALLEGWIPTETMRKRAIAGDMDAIIAMATRFWLGGLDVKQNYSEAARWYAMAANKGHIDAQLQLGKWYSIGHPVQMNLTEGVKWYRMAAQQGNAEGQFNVGFAYYTGRGVPQDHLEAAKWLRMAASDLGHLNAQYVLGLMYDKGEGVTQDSNEAYVLFSLAAINGETLPTQARDSVAKKLSPEALAKAQARARQIHEAQEAALEEAIRKLSEKASTQPGEKK